MEGWRSRQRPSGRLHRSQLRHHRRWSCGPGGATWSNIVTSPPKVTRQELDQTIDELRAIGGVHLLPIMTAIRDYGIAFAEIRQDTGPVSFRFDRPNIILLGDDL